MVDCCFRQGGLIVVVVVATWVDPDSFRGKIGLLLLLHVTTYKFKNVIAKFH